MIDPVKEAEHDQATSEFVDSINDLAKSIKNQEAFGNDLTGWRAKLQSTLDRNNAVNFAARLALLEIDKRENTKVTLQ